MTRKDYEAIAAALAQTRHQTAGAFSDDVHRDASLRIADVMARDNPRFDRTRFLKDCGVQS